MRTERKQYFCTESGAANWMTIANEDACRPVDIPGPIIQHTDHATCAQRPGWINNAFLLLSWNMHSNRSNLMRKIIKFSYLCFLFIAARLLTQIHSLWAGIAVKQITVFVIKRNVLVRKRARTCSRPISVEALAAMIGSSIRWHHSQMDLEEIRRNGVVSSSTLCAIWRRSHDRLNHKWHDIVWIHL